MHYLKNEQECFAGFETRGAAVSDVSFSSDCHRALCSRWPQPSRTFGLPVPVVFWVSHNRDFKIQRRGRQRESRKINRFYEQTTTLNKQTKFYLFLNMVMVPRNSTPGGFAYIRQSKRVMIAIKTERSQIHFLSDVLVAVVSLDLKVSNGSLRCRRNLIAVSNVCEAAPRFLFDAPNGTDLMNQLSEGRLDFPSTRTGQSRHVLNPGTQQGPRRL